MSQINLVYEVRIKIKLAKLVNDTSPSFELKLLPYIIYLRWVSIEKKIVLKTVYKIFRISKSTKSIFLLLKEILFQKITQGITDKTTFLIGILKLGLKRFLSFKNTALC